MKIVKIAFTVYPVIDSKQARRFHEGTLGLAVSRVFGGNSPMIHKRKAG